MVFKIYYDLNSVIIIMNQSIQCTFKIKKVLNESKNEDYPYHIPSLAPL